MKDTGQNSNGRIEVYSYTNYRKLLKDYYESEKKNNPGRFSYRSFAKRVGLATSNFLYQVITSRKNLSYSSTQRVARALGLNRRETHFFEALVHFDQVRDPQEKIGAFEKMVSFREYRSSKKLDPDQYDYFSKWYYPVIRELVLLPDFQENPIWISKKLSSLLTVDEAREALEKLQRMKMLVRESNGRLCQADPNLKTDEDVTSAALLKFHQSMMEHGMKSLQQPAENREISALTMSLSKKQFFQVKEMARQFHRDVQRLIAENGTETVEGIYQLNFQLFNFATSRRREP
ncbi:MAG: TIGR02147 family protein [Deltaproteobacteria bacterium]|nr:TIGR02147 family protein [Deltaproteobacteria bacterium]